MFLRLLHRLQKRFAFSWCKLLLFKAFQAFSLFQSESHFSTSFPTFDTALHGGLPCRTVTEVSGPQESGKTELVMQWAVHASLPERVGGLGQGTLFLDSDQTFSVQRYYFAYLLTILGTFPLLHTTVLLTDFAILLRVILHGTSLVALGTKKE